jgi:dinuclear metal center YbgI/SA1388 family protein
LRICHTLEGGAVRIADLLQTLDRLAPFSLAEPWDNCGLLMGDESAGVSKVLTVLDLTEAVLGEAIAGGCDTILTHHPAVFAPLKRFVESDPAGALVRSAVRSGVNVISCHTNLDAAPGGLADIVAEALGLRNLAPLQMASAHWYKLVGFVPAESLPAVSVAVFAAGAGTIGNYSECAYALQGEGWFKAGAAARPVVGQAGRAERVGEVRWETVVPQARLGAVIHAYVTAHPYEEPAFDIYPVEDRVPRAGLGRVGELDTPLTVAALALRAAETFDLEPPVIGGKTESDVRRVAVLPGSGRSMLGDAARVADVLVTGDLTYHDSDQARDLGLALVGLPHGDLEWAAMQRWAVVLRATLEPDGVAVALSQSWRSPWERVAAGGRSAPRREAEARIARPTTAAVAAPAAGGPTEPAAAPSASSATKVAAKAGPVRLWIDGGSRGNPGPSGIGVVMKSESGETLEEVGRTIPVGTNNVAEYQALLEALDLAARHGAKRVEINSDSELLVKQMRGLYRVKNETLRELYAEAKVRTSVFSSCVIRHVPREENTRADELVNEALDAAAGKKPAAKRRPATGGSASPGLF